MDWTIKDLPKVDIFSKTKEAMEAAQKAYFRPYIGMSGIGDPCLIKTFLQWRWAWRPSFRAETLALFDDGHRTEDLIALRLRASYHLVTHDRKKPRLAQIGVEALSGHLQGHLDGMILGLPHAPKKWHVWEHKTSTRGQQLADFYEENPETALLRWNETYYGQAQLYMHFMGEKMKARPGHVLTVCSPGGRFPWHHAFTPYDREWALMLLKRAKSLKEGAFDPKKDCRSPFCQYRVFHGRAPRKGDYIGPTEVNFRTSIHAAPLDRGWINTSTGEFFSNDPKGLARQKQTPERHLFHPLLIPYAHPTGEKDQESVEYGTAEGKKFYNTIKPSSRPNHYTSLELAALHREEKTLFERKA